MPIQGTELALSNKEKENDALKEQINQTDQILKKNFKENVKR